MNAKWKTAQSLFLPLLLVALFLLLPGIGGMPLNAHKPTWQDQGACSSEVTYTEAWDEALATDPVLLGLNAAAIAQAYGVGTVPPNTCEDGMGVAASTFEIPIPMLPLM